MGVVLGSDEVTTAPGVASGASVELLVLPSPDEPAAPPPLDDDPAPSVAWWVPAVIVAVVVLVGVVAAVVLADRPAPSRALGSDAEATVAVSTSAVPATDAPTTAAPTSAAPATAAPTTGAPTTVATTTSAPAGDEVLADGWVRTASAGAGFVVELPAVPSVSVRPVAAEGVVDQQELLVDAEGVQVGITSTERAVGDRDPDAFLREVVQVAAGQLDGSAQLGSSGVVGSGRYVDFRLTAASGRLVLGRAVWVDGRLHLLTSWGDRSELAAVHDRVTRTFTPR